MAKRQVYKKRGDGPGNTEESTFEQKEEKTEVPDVEGVMDQIDISLNKTKDVIVKEKKKKKKKKKVVVKLKEQEVRRRSCCWS